VCGVTWRLEWGGTASLVTMTSMESMAPWGDLKAEWGARLWLVGGKQDRELSHFLSVHWELRSKDVQVPLCTKLCAKRKLHLGETGSWRAGLVW
jgi:hypothetical protein